MESAAVLATEITELKAAIVKEKEEGTPEGVDVLKAALRTKVEAAKEILGDDKSEPAKVKPVKKKAKSKAKKSKGKAPTKETVFQKKFTSDGQIYIPKVLGNHLADDVFAHVDGKKIVISSNDCEHQDKTPLKRDAKGNIRIRKGQIAELLPALTKVKEVSIRLVGKVILVN
jgi:hypothetical protein